ncbi:TIGR00730 family Rossman fold protein [Candidatus Babeliales bacterium]|nr:TIGR00730 family Rossman fold protein [Candidatus Babeliales bacterium]
MIFFKRIKKYLKFLKSLYKTNWLLLRGMWKLTKLPQPTITVFGGSRIKKDDIYAKRAFELSKKLVEEGFSIITGGGGGIMEAANQGAYEAASEHGIKNGLKKIRMTSIGITLTSFKKDGFVNPYLQEKIFMNHFFSRKWLMVRYAVGFAVFPGGFGTLDELFEIITLEQCYRMPKIPIVLMDKRYWDPIIHWMRSRALKHNLVSESDLDIIYVTSDVDKAVEILCKYCKKRKMMKHPLYSR